MGVKEVWSMRDRDEEIDDILSGKHKVNHISSAGTLRIRSYDSFTHYQYIPDLSEKG